MRTLYFYWYYVSQQTNLRKLQNVHMSNHEINLDSSTNRRIKLGKVDRNLQMSELLNDLIGSTELLRK